ncbi:hypothetical protein GCM10027422_19660 [Hymenobacter arcticus]
MPAHIGYLLAGYLGLHNEGGLLAALGQRHGREQARLGAQPLGGSGA